MVLANSYVIEHICEALEKNKEEGERVFKKFLQRYSEDPTLTKLYQKFRQEKIDEVRESLEKLKNSRKLRVSGSGALWYNNRRP